MYFGLDLDYMRKYLDWVQVWNDQIRIKSEYIIYYKIIF